jgi:thymidylate synthase (FAD)
MGITTGELVLDLWWMVYDNVCKRIKYTNQPGKSMNIVEPYAKLLPPPSMALNPVVGEFTLTHGTKLLRYIEWCARISHRTEDAMTLSSYDRFLRSVVLSHGDWSVVEHASVSVDFYVDRGITHEAVRHRLFSFTQESTRFVNYIKKMLPSFIYPRPEDEYRDPDWDAAIAFVEETYQKLIAKGWSPQHARSVFPNALASRIVVTGNLRNWRHFLQMRTTKETHPQFREVTIPLLAEFQSKIPILFEDIQPLGKQADIATR